MLPNNELKVHFVNVNHGDATILEFPDYAGRAHFGVVDFGAKSGADRGHTRDYMQALVTLRQGNDPNLDYAIEFACATHPHNDHYGGLSRFMDVFADDQNPDNNKINMFWDCGFRTNSTMYNRVLEDILNNDNLTFLRVAAGSEFEYGETRITVLAPSVDLRNRFDTFGIGKNDASIVLKVKFRNSYIILAADAEFASWGKSTEEFPRMRNITFFQDAAGLAERGETSDQLRCNLLKLSHHGSKHGNSLEYLERLDPTHVVIPAGSQPWYQNNVPQWVGKFPHPLVTQMLDVLGVDANNIRVMGEPTVGNVIYKYSGGFSPRAIASFTEQPGTAAFAGALQNNWA